MAEVVQMIAGKSYCAGVMEGEGLWEEGECPGGREGGRADRARRECLAPAAMHTSVSICCPSVSGLDRYKFDARHFYRGQPHGHHVVC